MRRIPSLIVAALAVMFPSLPGCGTNEPPPPPTFKVAGKVLHKDGKPYTGKGMIEFRSVANPQNSTLGDIGDDGSFALRTIVGNRAVEGAQEGDHTVTVTMPLEGGKKVRAMPLKTHYAIKAGETNDLVVKLEK